MINSLKSQLFSQKSDNNLQSALVKTSFFSKKIDVFTKEKELAEITANFSSQSSKLEKETQILKLRLQESERKTQEFERISQEFERKSQESERKTHELERKSQESERKSQEFERKSQEFERKTKEFERKSQEFERKSEEIEKKSEEFERQSQEFEKKSQEFEKKSQELQKKLEFSDFSHFSLRKDNDSFKESLLILESSYLKELDELKRAYSMDLSKMEALNKSLASNFKEKSEEFEVLSNRNDELFTINQRILQEKAKIQENFDEKLQEFEEKMLFFKTKEFEFIREKTIKQEENDVDIKQMALELEEIRRKNEILLRERAIFTEELEGKKRIKLENESFLVKIQENELKISLFEAEMKRNAIKTKEFDVSGLKEEIIDLKRKLNEIREKYEDSQAFLLEYKGKNSVLKEKIKGFLQGNKRKETFDKKNKENWSEESQEIDEIRDKMEIYKRKCIVEKKVIFFRKK